jgi:hypothetical protein
MNKQDIQKIKTGLDNYRFSYLNGYVDHGDEVEYTTVSSSLSGLYYIVESDMEKTRYYKRISDAINLFNKRTRQHTVWLDLEHPINDSMNNIKLEDLDSIDLDDLRRL